MTAGAASRYSPSAWLPLALGALVTLAAVAGATAAEVTVPVLGLVTSMVAGVGLYWVLRPSLMTLLHLGVFGVVALSLAVQGSDDGIDAAEIAFGLSIVLYTAAWYGVALGGGLRIIRSGPDAVGALFLAGSLTVGVGVGVVSGTGGADFRSDLSCLLTLLLFFPAREACLRLRRGPTLLAGTLLALGTVASVSNLVKLRETLSGARESWEVIDVRVASGEVPIIVSFILVFLWLSVTRSWRTATALLLLGALLTVGLILTKSRGSWLTAAGGLGLGALLVPWNARKRLLGTLMLAGVGALAGGVALAGPRLALIGLGFLNRLTSISTAATQDISLLNRFYESDAAWAAIATNPILGHGWGTPLRRLNIIYGGDYVWSFIHNGYLWLWHKVGIWGLALFMMFLVGTALRGSRASRTLEEAPRAFVAGGIGGIAALAVLALPSNPFAVLDQMLVIALVLALVSGTSERARRPYAP